MKKVISIVSIIILFVIAGLIFWAGISPKTFLSVFKPGSAFSNIANKVGIIDIQGQKIATATSSESVLNNQGQVIIRRNIWDVEIADNNTATFSNRKILYRNQGKLFASNEMGIHNSGLNDVLIPLDIIFFDNNWRIVHIELSTSTNSEVIDKQIKYQYVLGINASEALTYGLQVGDQAIFLNK